MSRKGAALLAFLSLRPSGATREDLAELLWGPGRLANLRQELYALRQLPGASEWLEVGDTLAVHADTDVGALERAVERGEGGEFTTGELLPGLERVGSPAYVDWLELERQRLTDIKVKAARLAAERLQREGRHAEALRAIDAALEADPLDERLVRAAMRSAYANGDAADALERFEALRQTLRKELGLQPADRTLELAERMRRGEPLPIEMDIAMLGPELKRLAQVLALAEGALDVESVARVVERPPLDVAADLAGLERSGWLGQDLRLTSEASEVVLDSTTAVVRRLLHKRVAEALGLLPGPPPAVVADHLLAAGNASDAARKLLEAAEQAIRDASLQTAVAHLMRAMWSSWESPHVRLRAALLLEGCASQLADHDLQEAALGEAEQLAWRLQTDEGLADVRMRRSRTQLRRGLTGQALESALEALAIATRLGDERLVARARNAVGGAQFLAGDLDGAEGSFRANVDAADPVERYRSRNNLGSIAGIRGRLREAVAHLEEALTLGRAVGERASVVGTLNNLAATAERLGDYRRAIKHFKESLTLARESGSAAHEGQVLVNVSVVYARLGELGPAWNTALEVEEIADLHDEPRLVLLAHEQKAEVANLCGAFDQALDWLGSAAGLAERIGDERKRAAVSASQAVVAALRAPQELEEAVAWLDRLEEARLADLTPWLWLELACSSLEPEVALRFSDRAEAHGSASEHVSAVVDLARLRAGLLAGASDDQLLRAEEAFMRLADRPGNFEFQQSPHARLLCAVWRATHGDLEAVALEPARREVEAALAQQAQGLPATLAAALRDRPSAWLSCLAASFTV